MAVRVLRPKDLPAVLGVSRDTAWRISRREDFPLPRRIYGEVYGWLSEEIDTWLRARPVSDATGKGVS